MKEQERQGIKEIAHRTNIDFNLPDQPNLCCIGSPLFQIGYLAGRLCSFGFRETSKLLVVTIATTLVIVMRTSRLKSVFGFTLPISRNRIRLFGSIFHKPILRQLPATH